MLPLNLPDRDEAVATALRIIAGADQSSASLVRKLRQKGFDDDVAEAAAAQMVEWGYINDGKLSASIAAKRRRQGYGPAKIAADLRGRGIDQDSIDLAVHSPGEDDELSSANTAAEKWLRTHPRPENYAGWQRLGGWLQRRGFSSGVVVGVLQELRTAGNADA